jgi:amino acid transporter
MFIADIAAAACSAFALAYTLIYSSFILRLPERIADTARTAAERNAKLIILVLIGVAVLIILVKFTVSVGKLLCRRGMFPSLYKKSNTKKYRIFAVCAGGGTAFYVLSVFMLLIPFNFNPNRVYTSNRRRNEDMELSQMWEMNWVLPMLTVFLILFIIMLLINVVRLKLVLIKYEHDELYTLHETRKVIYVKCTSCGFDNHTSSTNCGECGAEIQAKGLAANFDRSDVVEAFGNVKL